jgi:hypothetical protein
MTRSGRHTDPFTIDDLAGALRGIPRDAAIYVHQDGKLRPVVGLGSTKISKGGDAPWQGDYAVVLELRE